MQKFSWKYILALIVLIVGIIVVWKVEDIRNSIPSLAQPSPLSVATQSPIAEKSGKVLLRFKNFEYGKTWNANFELINDTTQPIIYVGRKFQDATDYCTIAVRYEDSSAPNDRRSGIKVMDACYYGTRFSLQTLDSGERIGLSADEYNVREMLGLKEKKLDTIAQIGFEIFIGEGKQREIVWSDEITFPYDEYRYGL